MANQGKIAIVAGGGILPLRLAEACAASKRPYLVVLLDGQSDRALFTDHPTISGRMGAAGKIIKQLRDAAVAEIVMAGPVRRPTLFELKPDWFTAGFFARIGLRAMGDDALLKSVARTLEAEGFTLKAIQDLLPDNIMPAGVLGRSRPDAQAQADIAHGMMILRSMAALDIGQAVAIQQGIVLAVEAIEGTDAMIARAGQLARAGSRPVLVKLAKTGQDNRLDLPAIGPNTMDRLAEAGFAGVALEAGNGLLIEAEQSIALADAHNLFICGIA